MDSRRPMPALRAVFLDIGDTVMRPEPSWEDVYAIAFGEFGISVSVPELHHALRRAYHHGGWGMADGFDPTPETSFRRTVEIDSAAIAELGIGPMSDAFYLRLSELFLDVANWHVFADATGALDQLRDRGLRIGAVSNWVWSLPDLLESLDLARRFDFIVASARIGFEKPNPGIFHYALEQAGVKPEEALHVGDHLDADVQGARSLGIGAVLIDRRERFDTGDVPPDVPIIRSLDELLPLVDARRPAERLEPA
jgi:putative hydrolase of the HAD superfamily